MLSHYNQDNALIKDMLVIEDSAEDAYLISSMLRHEIPGLQEIDHAKTLQDGLEKIEHKQYDLTILDYKLPDSDGLHSLQELRESQPSMPIIILTGMNDETIALDALSHGAQDYIYKNKLTSDGVRAAIQYSILRKRFENQLIEFSKYDSLTGLSGRALFDETLNLAMLKNKRFGDYCGLLFMDLDKFKQINDTYGHVVGDKLLQEIAKRLTAVCRSYDRIARLGGDEFAVILERVPNLQHCKIVARKIIKSLQQPIEIDTITLRPEISIGIALHSTRDKITLEEFICRADNAMYKAKQIPGSAFICHDQHPTMRSYA